MKLIQWNFEIKILLYFHNYLIYQKLILMNVKIFLKRILSLTKKSDNWVVILAVVSLPQW
jgi:hypothetical protein